MSSLGPFVTLCLVGLASVPSARATDATDATSDVLVLTDGNWDTEGPPGRPNDTFLVKFYAP